MTMLATALSLFVLQAGWTWTLYEGEGPLVLANEIPDTPQLRAVMECEPGSGVAQLDLYGSSLTPGMASVTSGDAAALVVSLAADDHRRVAIRSDHPVFGQFVLTGDLSVAVAGQVQSVGVPSGHLAKLRRFAELCGG
jgi:hypothetical protein